MMYEIQVRSEADHSWRSSFANQLHNMVGPKAKTIYFAIRCDCNRDQLRYRVVRKGVGKTRVVWVSPLWKKS